MVPATLADTIQLVPDGTLFLHIAIILVMIFVLNRTLFKPINRILEERERRTRGRSGEAHEILERVEGSMSQYERTLREARAESYRLLELQRAEAMRTRQQRLSGVREETEQLIEGEKEALKAQTVEARATLEGEARQMAASISSQILGRAV